MRCRYCHIALAPLRSLADGEFCCDDHRDAFEQQQSAAPEDSHALGAPQAFEDAAEPVIPVKEESQAPEAPQVFEDIAEPVIAVKLVESRVPAALRMLRVKLATLPPPSALPVSEPIASPIAEVEEPATAAPEAPAEVAFSLAPELPTAEEAVLEQRIELPAEQSEVVEPYASESIEVGAEVPVEESNQLFEALPQEAEQRQNIQAFQTTEPEQEAETYQDAEAYEDVEPSEETRSFAAFQIAASWQWIRTAWNGAPRDLKLVTVLLPILAAVAVTGSFPKVPIKTVAPAQLAEVQKAVNEHWKNFNQSISNRAAIAYADDFRSGLDAWESRSNLTTSWSYDAAGFVRPGPLAVYKPSLDMSDYRFEFLGEIDQKAIGWVFRAEDLNNYYAMKLVVVKPGPLPLVNMVRYAVINGKEGPHVEKPLPLTVRADMLYRVMVDVRDADFTVMAQGQVVDFWTDHRLQHGGVGFFSNRGERSRLRWVEISHQYDALGRVCAYLAPYGMEGRNGSFN